MVTKLLSMKFLLDKASLLRTWSTLFVSASVSLQIFNLACFGLGAIEELTFWFSVFKGWY